MASTLSRRLSRLLLTNSISRSKICSQPRPFCSNSNTNTTISASDSSSESSTLDSLDDTELDSAPSSSKKLEREIFDRKLEDGVDIGIYKAIVVGQVGQTPIQKRLNSGRTLTMLSVGTGGIRNNRRPLDNEDPKEYANRCAVQWHRVSIYPERLGNLAMKNAVPGSLLYIEGNLETKIFSDPITGFVRRVREIAVRLNGRIVFLGKGSDFQQEQLRSVHLYRRSVGYY